MTALSPEDIALLRRFEPIACFNEGEQFYPMDVERYIAASRLCVQRPNDVPEVLVPAGQLTIERLAQPRRDVPGSIYYLSFADPASPSQVISFRSTSTLRNFHAGPGRLARVGLTARLADLIFSLSLLLRGRVPGGLATAAALRYQELQAQDERYCYYGRVVRDHGYIAIQYWFFYAFNDWRSSFNGVNDHESDWEMITVYAVEDAAGVAQPCWVAYSAHEFEGDDLRRRWDDPEIEREGEHPIIYIAAGAHANYYFRGEYMPVAEIPYTAPLLRAWRQIQHFWRVTLRQGDDYSAPPETGFVRIPFVDYARGDGLRIGPGQRHTWEPRLLQATPTAPVPAWVDGYQGLWGLYTRDPIAGEDAPAGPKYNRDGSVRKMWYDPLGWSGLDKVPPPGRAEDALALQQQRLREEQEELHTKISDQTAILNGLEMEFEAIQGATHLRIRAIELQRRIRAATVELDRLKARRAANEQVLDCCIGFSAQIGHGRYGSPRAHLRLPQLPASNADLRLGRAAETWSAISIGVLLLGFVVITQLGGNWEIGLIGLLGIYGFLEALFRRQVEILIRYLVVMLALITALILVFEFFWSVLVTLLLLAGVLIIVENVRELRSRD